MFRLTNYMQRTRRPDAGATAPGFGQSGETVKPVVIWNLTRRCNLRCRHCYTTSADIPFPGD